jgi:molybdopterin molybdotransferase
LSGRADLMHPHFNAKLGRDLAENDERADYLRATLDKGADGELTATPVMAQDSSLMANLSKADCLLIREPHAPAAATGSLCVILKLSL